MQTIRDNTGNPVAFKATRSRDKPPTKEELKRVNITQALRTYLAKNPYDAERLVEALIQMGLTKGLHQLEAIREIVNRLEGKPTEHREISGELPIHLTFTPVYQIEDVQKLRLPENTPEIVEGMVTEIK